MKKTFYSNGKLLITGEYAVLDGAKAFALPTKKGQYLHTEPLDINIINWKSLDADGSVWYEDSFTIDDIYKNTYNGTDPVTPQLIKILHTAHNANDNILTSGYTVVTELTFARQWGLGTSSTLINNIAQWFNTDPYRLLWDSFGGSGYDIACARHNLPLLYSINHRQQPTVRTIDFTPAFTGSIYFVYLNQKQNSRSAIAAYNERKQEDHIIERISAISETIIKAADLQQFTALLEEHEILLAKVLGLEPVKRRLFPDFNGTVKSLGAWGGDFVMAVSEANPVAYFKSKGYSTVIPYKQMIL